MVFEGALMALLAIAAFVSIIGAIGEKNTGHKAIFAFIFAYSTFTLLHFYY